MYLAILAFKVNIRLEVGFEDKSNLHIHSSLLANSLPAITAKS